MPQGKEKASLSEGFSFFFVQLSAAGQREERPSGHRTSVTLPSH